MHLIIALILLCIIAAIVLVKVIQCHKRGGLNANDYWLVQEFMRCNVMVFGKKGKGKDLLFAHVIALRGEKHYSNMEYNDDTEVISLKEVALGKNTFEDCINDTIKKLPPRFESGCDIYITDGGIYLPSQYNKLLNDLYPSMPLLYALSRQVYQNNIHANVQAFGRLWDKLREQADSYIRVVDRIEHEKYFLVKTICYEEYAAAESCLLPCGDLQYIATHGNIKKRTFKVMKASLQYDTHYFKKVFLEDDETPLERVTNYVER